MKIRDIDVVLRYKPMADFIRMHAKQNASILEVGAGREGIGKYLKEFHITAVDKFQNNVLPNVKQVKGEAKRLPVRNRGYDVVISSDMLEHVPARDRKKILQEMLRASRKYVLIGFPCGPGAAFWEQVFFRTVKALTGKEHRWVKEHMEYGLPDLKMVRASLKRSGWNITEMDNGSGAVWCICQFLNPVLYPLLYLFSPLLAHIRAGKPYRKIFIGERVQ